MRVLLGRLLYSGLAARARQPKHMVFGSFPINCESSAIANAHFFCHKKIILASPEKTVKTYAYTKICVCCFLQGGGQLHVIGSSQQQRAGRFQILDEGFDS